MFSKLRLILVCAFAALTSAANAATINVGTTSPIQTATLSLPAGGNVASIAVLTQGAPNLDFALVSGGTCASGTTYSTGTTCTVEYTFTPTHPGSRNGAITLNTSTGTALATTYISGQGTGPQITFLPVTQTVVSSGLTTPYGVVIDGKGDLFIAESGLNRVVEIFPGGGLAYLGTGLNSPENVAIDGAGNLFVTCQPDSSLHEIVAAGGYSQTLTIGTGFKYPLGVAVDQSGNVFVADTGNNAVKEVVAAGSYSSTQTLGTYSIPTQLAIDAAGDLFVVVGSLKVQEILAAGGYTQSKTLPVGFFGNIQNLVVDGLGNVILDDAHDANLEVYSVANGYTSLSSLPLPASIISPAGLAIDSSGNVFIADLTGGTVSEEGFSGPPTLNFQTTPYGQTSKDSPQSVTLTNNGNAPLIFTSGSPAITPGYTLGSASTCPVLSTSGTLAAGVSCAYLVNYTPVLAGPNPGSLVLTDNNLNVTSATQTIPLNGVSTGIAPTIVFSVPGHTASDPPFTVTATSNSTGAFTYSVVSGPATISGNTVTLTGSGTVVLQVSQAASANYTASTAQASFNVAAVAPAITFSVPNHTYGDPPFTVAATSSTFSGFTYSVVSGPATISGATVTLTGAGTVVLGVLGINGTSAGSVTATFTVAKAAQTINFTQPTSPVIYGVAPFALTASATSNGPIAFSVLSGPATVSGNTVSITGTGTVVLAADQSGTANYNAAPEVARTLLVYLGSPAVTLSSSAGAAFLLNPITLAATVSSSAATPTGSIIFRDGTTVLGTVIMNGGTASLTTSALALGPHTITAAYSGDTNFAASNSTAITETIQDFSIAFVGSTAPVIAHGGTALYNLTLSPIGGATMPAAIVLAVSGEPGQSQITLTPQSIASGSGTTGVTLKMQTPDYPTVAFAFVLGAFLLGICRRIKPRLLLVIIAAGALMSGITGCGTGWPAQNFQIVVTATSGALNHATTATLTSQ